MDGITLEVKLKKSDKTYRPDDAVEGKIVVTSPKGFDHQGIRMSIEGAVQISSSGKTILIDYKSPPANSRNIILIKEDLSICGVGKFSEGTTELPFEFILRWTHGPSLVESYHGVYISVIYMIYAECDRGILKKSIQANVEFLVQVPSSNISPAVSHKYVISPDTLRNLPASELAELPKFKMSGKITRSNCFINRPFSGTLVIEKSDALIKSIELQLVRIESVTIDDSIRLREATEIQSIQIADGNICKGIALPLHMVFPRLFSCPTVLSTVFNIEFEINLLIIFENNIVITENFPILMLRESCSDSLS